MKENKNFINRNKYNDIKRMGHSEMNEYINGIRKVEYEKGYDVGYKIGRVDGHEQGTKDAENAQNTRSEVDFDKIKASLMKIKGIGEVKSAEILKILEEELGHGQEKTT